MKKTVKKYKKVLLTGKSEALDLAIQRKLTQNPKFMHNFYASATPANQSIGIQASWNNLDYLIIEEKTNIKDIKADDILVYVGFAIDRPSTDVSSIQLISFCDNIDLVCKIASDMCNHLWECFKTNIIHFSAREGATTYRLFDKIHNDEKLAEKLFSNWYGRYIGYKTNAFISQDNSRHNLHLFEIIRRDYADSLDNAGAGSFNSKEV